MPPRPKNNAYFVSQTQANMVAALNNKNFTAFTKLCPSSRDANSPLFIDEKMGENFIIYFACRALNFEILQYLVAIGATLEPDNESPIMGTILRACADITHHQKKQQALEIAQFLLVKGAQIDRQDREGRTLLLDAVHIQQIELIELLLKQNPFLINIPDQEGFTPLHVACQYNNLHIINLLLDNGACIDAIDEYGETPLGKTINLDLLEPFKLLIARQADINIINIQGESPLIVCARVQRVSYVKILPEKHADPSVDVCGNTALESAIRVGNLDIIRLFRLHHVPLQEDMASPFSCLAYATEQLDDLTFEAILNELIAYGYHIDDRSEILDNEIVLSVYKKKQFECLSRMGIFHTVTRAQGKYVITLSGRETKRPEALARFDGPTLAKKNQSDTINSHIAIHNKKLEKFTDFIRLQQEIKKKHLVNYSEEMNKIKGSLCCRDEANQYVNLLRLHYFYFKKIEKTDFDYFKKCYPFFSNINEHINLFEIFNAQEIVKSLLLSFYFS